MCGNASSTSARIGEESTSPNQSVNSNTRSGRALTLYRAWQIFSGISVLLLFSTIGALLSAQDHEIVVRQYTSTFMMLSVSMALAAAFLIFGCIEYHTPWTNGILKKQESTSKVRPCDFEKFRDGYNKMRSARAGIYIEVILSFFLYLLPQYITRISYFSTYSVIYDWFFVLSVLANGFALAQCSFQTSWIGTSRRTPSIGIAVANVILYFAVVLDLVCNGTNQILLYPFLDITGASLRENINNIFNSIPAGMKTGVIVATGVALLKDFISQMFASINNQHSANLTQQRRHIRHRLLTHWNYTGRVSTFSRENFRAEFLTTNVLIGAFFVLIVISHNAWDTVPSPDTPEDGIVSVAIYSLIFMLFSFASLWSIRDETLIQSEHMYLSVKSIKLDKDSIRKSHNGQPTSAWMDFCQVLCNLTANVSGIDSEDADYQNIAPMIIATAQMITLTKDESCKPDECKRSLFFCDILRAKGNIQALILRDASHEKNENDTIFYSSNAPLQIARDLRFANLMADLMGDDSLYPVEPKSNECVGSNQKGRIKPFEPYDLTPLCFVKKLLTLFFDTDLDFGSTPDIYNCSNADVIQLLKIDVFHFLFRYEIEHKKSRGIKTCGLSWLGCNCRVSQTPCEPKTDNKGKRPREELILTMPFIVVKCFDMRWENTKEPMLDHVLLEAVLNYYMLFLKGWVVQRENNVLDEIAFTTFRQLTDMRADLSLVERIIYMLCKLGNLDGDSLLKDNEALGQKYTKTLSTMEGQKCEGKGSGAKDRGIQEAMLRRRVEELLRNGGNATQKKSSEDAIDWNELYGGWKRIVYMIFMKQLNENT